MLVRRSTYRRLEAELEAKLSDAEEALRRKTKDYNALMQQVNKEREKYSRLKDVKLYDDAGYKLARQALELIQHSAWFPTTNAGDPVYSREQVQAGVQRLANELGTR